MCSDILIFWGGGTPHKFTGGGTPQKFTGGGGDTAQIPKKNTNAMGWVVGGWVVTIRRIMPLRGSILQAGTCQILSLAESSKCSRVWQ